MLPDEPPASRGPGGPAGVGPDLAGRVLEGRYRIGELVARGGMASVYVATDLRLDRTVAVKVMHPSLGDPVTGSESFAQRFVREARAAARLSHPNVVAVHDQGSDAGLTFLVMEHVPGSTLRDVVRERAPLSPARALALLEPIVAAVSAAHRAGIVHRDVKPENVLIADDGRVKVADFGLARAVDADSHHTTTGGVLIGTVSYLAPELVVDGTADARADVYALGVVLHELLTGEKPHQGETPIQIAYKHVHADVPPPSRLVPGLPAYVDALVARATARDRGQRPADAGVLLHHVRRVQQALNEGVVRDDELVADLLPRPAAPDDTDTSPEPFDAADLEDLRGDGFAEAELYPALAQASVPDDGSTAVRRAPGPAAPPLPAGEVTSRLFLDEHDAGGPPGHDPDEPDDDPEAAALAARRTSRRRARLLGSLVIVLALVGGLAFYFLSWRYVPAPRLLDLTQAEATERAEADGFDVEVGPAGYSETVAAGLVMATDPEGGEEVVRGGTITLTVSRGPERYAVPSLRGRTADEARTALESTNLAYAEAEPRYDEEVPEGAVIATDPAQGTVVRPDATVTVVLSLGRRPIPVEDFTGRPRDEAEAALTTGDPEIEGDELQVSVSEEFSDTVPAGTVISQDPTGGTLNLGDTVTLVVSKGPELVSIPDGLVGGRVEDVRSQLEDLGLVVDEQGLIGSDGPRIGYVTGVSPGSGEQVRRGTTVTLTVL